MEPLERFLHVEAASGIVLVVAAAIGLAWANSPWSGAYEALWHTKVVAGIGNTLFEQTLHFWINEGLMTIFFFVVGLEIRREIHEGELSDLRKAALPVVAAIGGMAAPALIFAVVNAGDERALRGFGVPTATDIAFAVGVLALLGKRVPPALRVLLLALAIIDDIGAILIIAVFYSSGVEPSGLVTAAVGGLLVWLLQRGGARNALVYALPGAVIWWGLLRAGVHPTLAGVILGLMTPARAWLGEEGFVDTTREAIDAFDEERQRSHKDVHALLPPMRRIRLANREALSPVVRIQAALHGWVAFGIMPLFALANAGVPLGGFDAASRGSVSVLVGVVAGLVIGKPLGILFASLIAVRLGVCRLPAGVDVRGLTVVGLVAGIGFTMAIFIAGLAFDDAALLAAAKLGVLIASLAAAVAGLAVGRILLPNAHPAGAASTVTEAEAAPDI